MIVGVPHGPPTGVPLGFLAVRSKDKPAMTIGPLGPGGEPRRDLETINRYVPNIFGGLKYFLMIRGPSSC